MRAKGVRCALALALGLALVAAACGEPEPEPEPEMRLGTGEDRWVALEDGGSADLVCGPQGGQHVFVSVRARHLDPSRTTTRVRISRADDGALVCERRLEGVRLIAVEGWGEVTGIACFVVDPREVSGRAVVLDGEVVDTAGRSCGASVRLVVRGPTAPCS
ncbi:MAG: hypothetical protein IT384_31685 [Deltaproteobacteria bacterium]|nr:hypothetical protein [Deltaproteobacteria bacterium]